MKAFPSTFGKHSSNSGDTGTTYVATDGMELRDYFAAAAMTGVVRARSDADNIAVTAYEIADAMLEARKK